MNAKIIGLGTVGVILLGLFVGQGLQSPRPAEELPVAVASDSTRAKTKPQYMGRTSASHSGNLGGIAGANAKCQVNYAGSHMCTQDELVKSGETTFGGDGWVACSVRIVVPGPPGFETSACSGRAFSEFASDAFTDQTCGQWASASSGSNGPYVNSLGSGLSSSCIQSRPIHCCK